ncbi:MAG: hypothetical protein ACXVA0_23830 [Mucilaginibacter sp.]
MMISFASLNLTGCFYGVNNWGKRLNELNTDLDRELWYANSMGTCLSSGFIKERMSQRDIEIIEQAMVKTFQHFFPAHTVLNKVTERLTSEAGAKCIYQPNKNSNSSAQTICSYSHIALVGMKKFGLTGWEIYDVYWQKNNFEFAISSQDDHLTSSVGKVLEGECYDIDINAYKTTNTIKFIKKIP